MNVWNVIHRFLIALNAFYIILKYIANFVIMGILIILMSANNANNKTVTIVSTILINANHVLTGIYLLIIIMHIYKIYLLYIIGRYLLIIN
jgi:hypothetical protein